MAAAGSLARTGVADRSVSADVGTADRCTAVVGLVALAGWDGHQQLAGAPCRWGAEDEHERKDDRQGAAAALKVALEGLVMLGQVGLLGVDV